MDGEKTISNNIGDPACLKWVTDRICNMLRENQVELYREDNNCDAAKLWIYMDSLEGDDRKGITECKFIAGHYQMWDDIIVCTKSYGGCAFVDSNISFSAGDFAYTDCVFMGNHATHESGKTLDHGIPFCRIHRANGHALEQAVYCCTLPVPWLKMKMKTWCVNFWRTGRTFT